MKHIDLKVGIYDTRATITRHKNGAVTINDPYIKWTGNTGALAFRNIKLCGNRADIASKVFSDTPPMIEIGDYKYPMSYGEFLETYID